MQLGWLMRAAPAALLLVGLVMSGDRGYAHADTAFATYGQRHQDEVAGDDDEDEDGGEASDSELIGVDGDTYESPTWGYTIEWDRDIWEAVDSASEDDTDSLFLSSEQSNLFFSGSPAYDGDPEDCVQDWEESLSEDDGVDDWEPLEDEDGDLIEGEEDDRVWAAFSAVFTDDDGDEIEEAYYIECRVVVEDEATLAIVHLTILDEYTDEAELVEEVLDTIEIPTQEETAGNQTDEDLLADVETYEIDDLSHTSEDVDYDPAPPVGGPHDQVWQNCGFYDEPVRDENAVHSLEHGAVWITYDPDLSADDISILEDLADGQPYLLVSPYPDLPAPVVASAWGVQLLLDGADDPRLEAFVTFYAQGPQTPEPGAPCSGGTSATAD